MLQFFSDTPLCEIGHIELKGYKTHRATVHCVKDITIRHDLDSLSLLFGCAIRAKRTKHNPLKGEGKVERPSSEGSERIDVVSPADEEAYFGEARGNLHDLARLILLQGARPEEVMGLRKSSYDRAKGTIRIEGGKTKAAKRTLYLTGEACAIIESHLQGEGPWIFPSGRIKGGHLKQLNTAHDHFRRDAGAKRWKRLRRRCPRRS